MRAFLSLFALAVLSACATVNASAAELTHDDAVGIVHACLAVRIGFDEERETCIGEVSRVCGERQGEGASTTGAVVTCATLEAEAWRSILETLATQLRANESEMQVALLERALAAGEQWTRDRCAYDASQYEGGSLARLLSAQCARDTLGLRAIDLDRRVNPDER
jgi:hypothetical protein